MKHATKTRKQKAAQMRRYRARKAESPRQSAPVAPSGPVAPAKGIAEPKIDAARAWFLANTFRCYICQADIPNNTVCKNHPPKESECPASPAAWQPEEKSAAPASKCEPKQSGTVVLDGTTTLFGLTPDQAARNNAAWASYDLEQRAELVERANLIAVVEHRQAKAASDEHARVYGRQPSLMHGRSR